MKFLQRFSLVRINILSSLLASAVLITLATLLVMSELTERQNTERDIKLLGFMQALDGIAHSHAVERGLTAGYLGNPSDENRQKVLKQREVADQASARLMQLRSELGNQEPILLRSTDLLVRELDKKSALRAAVDRAEGAAAFGYYSRVNGMALDALSGLTTEISSNEVNTDLQLSLLLAKFKERAGQVRGKVNGVLASGKLSDLTRNEILGYQADMQMITDYLTTQFVGDNLKQVRDILNDSVSKEITGILDRVLADNPDFTTLPKPAVWFPLASKQIGNVKALLDQEWAKIAEQSQKALSQANFTLGLTLSLILIAVLALASINIAFTSLLRRSLHDLTQALTQISEERDLTRKLKLEGNNELTQIGHSVQHMLNTMESTLRELISSVNATSGMASELDKSSDELLGNARDTQQVATSISSAIEENAATSSEIANAAATTLDAVYQMTAASKENQARFGETSSIMRSLQQSAQQIEGLSQSLDRQVEQITESITVINTLFEQTNLLALNASIEAARAGEHGRGFAVVADEVRSLAIKSLESSERITEVLQSLQQASQAITSSASENGQLNQKAADVINSVQQSMEEMSRTMANLEDMATSVATASEEQSSVSSVIAQDTAAVLDASSSSLSVSQRLKQISEQYRDAGVQMLSLAGKFKV